MAAWGVEDMSASLPATMHEAEAAPSAIMAKTPQEVGWAPKTNYDYEKYNMSGKEARELDEAQAASASANAVNQFPGAVGGIVPGTWAANGVIYEWNDEYGDVGPRFEELEKQLFGSDLHVKSGVNFSAITQIDVIQEGEIRIDPVKSFENAGLHPVMKENVAFAGYTVPTPIQQYTLPAIFKGYDIVACAQTGSGKTASFLIPILSKLMGKAKKLAAPRPNPALYQEGIHPPVKAEPLVLIVAPTRELATQIFDEARRFCYRTMLRPCVAYGGCPLGPQLNHLAKGCDVLIGTPGRLVDFINRPHVLTLRRLKYMVIDEADEMLDMSWEEDLKKIMSGGDQEEGNINFLMFSATFPKAARELAKEHLAHRHVRISVGRAGSSHKNIRQDIIFVDPHAKRQALFDLLMASTPGRTIIFVNSKRGADEVDDFLFQLGIPCTSIHSGRTQREREDSLRAFRTGTTPVLIATGVSARGLDVHHVGHVINFDLPSSQYGGIQEYTHRIGRTARIGNTGLATSFYNDRDSDLAEVLVKTLLETRQVIPDFLQQYIPEGFTPEGDGDVSKLKFEDGSDNGDENAAQPGLADGEWGQPTENNVLDTSRWVQTVENASPAAPEGWSAPTATQTQPIATVSTDFGAGSRGQPSWGGPTLIPTPAHSSQSRNAGINNPQQGHLPDRYNPPPSAPWHPPTQTSPVSSSGVYKTSAVPPKFAPDGIGWVIAPQTQGTAVTKPTAPVQTPAPAPAPAVSQPVNKGWDAAAGSYSTGWQSTPTGGW